MEPFQALPDLPDEERPQLIRCDIQIPPQPQEGPPPGTTIINGQIQFAEPDNSEFHPDIDPSDASNLTRLIALKQCGWKLRREKGDRKPGDTCRWCRGPLLAGIQILVHDNGRCNNVWGASCFMEMLAYEIDHSRQRVFRCPMCRDGIYNCRKESYADFQQPGAWAPTAFLRVMLFSPDWVVQVATETRRPVILMDSDEVEKLVFWGHSEQRWCDCSAIMELDRVTRAFKEWILVDCGNNEYRMCPFRLVEKGVDRGSLLTMGAEQFNREAGVRGGLAAAAHSFEPDQHAERRIQLEGLEYVQKMVQSEDEKHCYAELLIAMGLQHPLAPSDRDKGKLKNPNTSSFFYPTNGDSDEEEENADIDLDECADIKDGES